MDRIYLIINLLYSNPQASVRTNNLISKFFFPIFRGTRQGCPLSPLLFNIAVEPLAVSLRENHDLLGIDRCGLNHKLLLYCDDLLLYLSYPDTSIPVALNVIKNFGTISGYKINFVKSLIFPLSVAAKQRPLDMFPFKIVCDSFKYLGVHVAGFQREVLRGP